MKSEQFIVLPWPHEASDEILQALVRHAPVEEGAGICVAMWTEDDKPSEKIDLDRMIGVGEPEYRFSRVLGRHAHVLTVYGKREFAYEVAAKIEKWSAGLEGISYETRDVDGMGITTDNDAAPGLDN